MGPCCGHMDGILGVSCGIETLCSLSGIKQGGPMLVPCSWMEAVGLSSSQQSCSTVSLGAALLPDQRTFRRDQRTFKHRAY